MDTQSMGGALYYVLFKDNCTKFRLMYFIIKHDEYNVAYTHEQNKSLNVTI
jgi:hypothetical protein